MLRLAGAAILMAFSTPAYAADWYYVSNATDFANISFIDKDSIRDGEPGITRASMFSLLAQPEGDDAMAYRFEIEVKCGSKESRLVAAEVFDSARTPRGQQPMETDWSPLDPGTQGETVAAFVCGKGKPGAANRSAGKQLPFDTGKVMLADLAKAHGK
jgi:hypothetical protein